jgi:hypothetical protein
LRYVCALTKPEMSKDKMPKDEMSKDEMTNFKLWTSECRHH